jgi:hypothetical protein
VASYKMVRFIPTNGHYEQSDSMDFIVVSLHPGSKFLKKKKPKHFKILEGRPKVLLYTYPKISDDLEDKQ